MSIYVYILLCNEYFKSRIDWYRLVRTFLSSCDSKFRIFPLTIHQDCPCWVKNSTYTIISLMLIIINQWKNKNKENVKHANRLLQKCQNILKKKVYYEQNEHILPQGNKERHSRYMNYYNSSKKFVMPWIINVYVKSFSVLKQISVYRCLLKLLCVFSCLHMYVCTTASI